MPNPTAYLIRPATASDIPSLLRLRMILMHTMEPDPSFDFTTLEQANRAYLECAVPSGEFLAWVADAGDEIVATVGMVIRSAPPTVNNLPGKEGYILNVVTAEAWQNQGIASALLKSAIQYLHQQRIPLATLRCRQEMRPFYERSGFKADLEMKRRIA
jgi:ribosomal protein S18 acetylase RimI-like enzyme